MPAQSAILSTLGAVIIRAQGSQVVNQVVLPDEKSAQGDMNGLNGEQFGANWRRAAGEQSNVTPALGGRFELRPVENELRPLLQRRKIAPREIVNVTRRAKPAILV